MNYGVVLPIWQLTAREAESLTVRAEALGVENSKTVYEYAKSKGVKVTLRLTSAEETGAEHCQHDNPTIGQELLADWLADVFGIDQRALAPLVV